MNPEIRRFLERHHNARFDYYIHSPGGYYGWHYGAIVASHFSFAKVVFPKEFKLCKNVSSDLDLVYRYNNIWYSEEEMLKIIKLQPFA